MNKEIAVYDNRVTAREYISYIAESAGGFACIGRDGKLYIKKIGETTATLPLKYFQDFKWGEKIKITRVSYEDGIQSFKQGDTTGNTIHISQDNMFIVDQGQIDNIYAQINGLEVYSFEGNSIIDPALDIGDLLLIDNKKVIYQGSASFGGKWKASIKSNIQCKAREETTIKKPSQKTINRRVQSQINQAEGKIAILAEEQGEIKEQIVKSVENIEGMQTITLPNCVEGNLLEFYIYGHNTDFNMLVPNNDLYPSDDLFPIGSGASSTDTYVIEVENEDGTKETYNLGEIVLLSKINDVQDEYVIKDGKASVIRRIDVENVEVQEEVIEELGAKTIFLKNGTNTITLLNYNAKMSAKYVIKNTYTDIFATKTETNAQINIKANEVSTEVNSSVTSAILTLLNNGYLTAEQVNSLVEGNTEEIATIKKQLKQTVTDSQMQIAISTAFEGGISYLKNTLFTINEEGMWIATSEDEFNALYNNKGMYLYSYNQMIAKFDVNGATLNNLKVLGTIETPHSKKMAITANGEERIYDFWID